MQWIKSADKLPSDNETYHIQYEGYKDVAYCESGEWYNAGTDVKLPPAFINSLEWLNEERIDPDFVDFMNDAKQEFITFINKQDWNNELRTNAESFMIAYDQIAERLVKAVG